MGKWKGSETEKFIKEQWRWIVLVAIAVLAAVPDWVDLIERRPELGVAFSPFWQVVLGLRVPSVLVGLGVLAWRWREVWLPSVTERYVRALWRLVFRPAMDRLRAEVVIEADRKKPELGDG